MQFTSIDQRLMTTAVAPQLGHLIPVVSEKNGGDPGRCARIHNRRSESGVAHVGHTGDATNAI